LFFLIVYMLDNRFNYINVPGLGGSGEHHWQTFWEQAYPEIHRVQQADWDHPICSVWVNKLQLITETCSDKPVVLIAHSLGCVTVLHAVAQRKLKGIAGAFLVAMPDAERADFPKECIGFIPVPRIVLPFPAVMIASENDPYITSLELKKWADVIQASFVSVGQRGHIGTAAQLTYWEEGQQLFRSFVEQL
jgi:predicted alpha/beta hydrolase family esterase